MREVDREDRSGVRGTVTRRPAADVYDEIQSAKAAQEAADHEARKLLRDQRRAEHKDKWEQFKNKVGSSAKTSSSRR